MKKHCVTKISQRIWERFLYENNCNHNSYKVSYKFAFIPYLSFCRKQKRESSFQQVGHLVVRNFLVFCLQQVVLYFKGVLNSIDFYEKIFLHVIPARIIVSWMYVLACPKELSICHCHNKKAVVINCESGY